MLRKSLSFRFAFKAGLLLTVFGISVAYAGQCCQSGPAPACSGCVSIGNGSIHLGSNTAQKCAAVPHPASCGESMTTCVSLQGAPLYNEGCGTVIGTVSIDIETPQCGAGDSSCNAG